MEEQPLATAYVDVEPRLLRDTLSVYLASRGFRLVTRDGAGHVDLVVTHDDATPGATVVVVLPKQAGAQGHVLVEGRDVDTINGLEQLEPFVDFCVGRRRAQPEDE